MNPLVSIIIPVYNGSNYLNDAIQSALSQTYKNIEIIVVNDGSKDNNATEEIALRYADRIKYVTKENGGIASALNAGIKAMSGTYFSWLSHDDLYEPTKIEEEVKHIESEGDIILCSGRQIDFNGNAIGHDSKCINARLSSTELFHIWLWKNYELNGLGFLVPRSVFDEVGLFDESLYYLQDLDMWIRIMFSNKCFTCIPNKLVITRIHRNQTTNLHKERYFIDGRAMRIKHINMMLGLDPDVSMIKDYIYLCAKSGLPHNDYKLLEDLLKTKKGSSLSFYVIKCFFKIKGIIIKYARKCRDYIMKLKGLRG